MNISILHLKGEHSARSESSRATSIVTPRGAP